MIRIEFWDDITTGFIAGVDRHPAVPRVGDEAYFRGVNCRVTNVLWDHLEHDQLVVAKVFFTPLSEKLYGKRWWVK